MSECPLGTSFTLRYQALKFFLLIKTYMLVFEDTFNPSA